ncbi:MAG: hypothetical protein H0U88_07915 [Chthoniobacterales bacterium]|nr:hypothetical protein [Chthoniobacterales bacterium]MDQ3118417.1 hypothetical protein [Verrucomicrobiota bacterium]
MTKVKEKRSTRAPKGPVRMLEAELLELRRDLRATLRAYAARLEVHLAEGTAVVAASKDADDLPREQLHRIRDLTMMVRNRKVKPEKGRRKDLRKLDSLIEELQLFAQKGNGSAN